MSKVFITGGVPTKEFPIRTQFIPLDKQRCAFLSSYKFGYTLRKLETIKI